MDKSEAIKQAQILEAELAALKKIIEAPEVTAEQRFLQLVENVEIKRDLEKYPYSVFFFNVEKLLAEYHTDCPENLWIAKDIWKVFEVEFAMERADIQAFMRDQIEKYFKMKVSEIILEIPIFSERIEKHFKMKASEH